MDPLRRLTRTVAQQLGEGPGPERRARQRRAVARLARRSAAPTSGRWRWAVPVLAAMLLVWAWARVPAPTSAPHSAGVGEAAPMAGAWLAASSQEPLAVVFPDRSRIDLAPGAQARLAQVEAAGVQLDLQSGRVALAPNDGSPRAWRIVAGPFTIAGAGARFHVEWNPQRRVLAVEVTSGSVQVHGGSLLAEGTRVGAGQRLEIADEPVVPAGAAAQAAEAALAPATSERAPARPEVHRRESWAALAEAGEHAAALAEAERHGFTALLERLDAEGLDRLAHSARLAGAGGRAREALLALRRRFPRSSRAGTAAFVLARVAVDLERDPPAAIAWFGRYLAEHPDGPLAEEARGRLLRTLHDEGEVSRARAAADDYLRHHPDGSHATLARTILGP